MRTAPAAPPATRVTCWARVCAATKCPTPLTTTSVLRQTCRTWSCATFCKNVITASAFTGSLSATMSDWITGLTRHGGRGCCWHWKVINTSQITSTCSWGCLYRSALPRTPLWTPCCQSISIPLGAAIQRVGSCPLTRTTTQTGRGLNWTFPMTVITGLWLWETSGKHFLKLSTSIYGAGSEGPQVMGMELYIMNPWSTWNQGEI